MIEIWMECNSSFGGTAQHSVYECVMFSAYGNVKATKVISDRAGVSKGYGFVTFETEEEAKRLMQDVSSLYCCHCEMDCLIGVAYFLNVIPYH